MRGAGAAILIAAFALFASPLHAQNVIPLPAKVTLGSGAFLLDATTVIRAPQGSHDAVAAARYLAELWQRSNHISLKVVTAEKAANASLITFQTLPGFAPEGYRVVVQPRRITVAATTAAGLFYGAVTVWQLLPTGTEHGEIADQVILDEPRYAWRGLMLDSARHFQSPAFVRSMIDWMAWHKLNVLHWHLTDDQGWRLEIRKYPRLTTVGAWRIPATIPGAPASAPYGGFYTQQQVRAIVAFAATRHVQIVPEIDMPGHAQAAIAAYPTLSAIDSHPELPVSSRWGIHSHLFSLEPATFEFLQDVLDEVLQLFPSRYIHIGGDEVVKEEWRTSAAVQARAKQLGIDDVAALQTYFTQKISRYLTAAGRRAVGWDEILQTGLGQETVVMSWHGTSGARQAAVRGNDAVLAPDPMLYFDHRQSDLAGEPPGRLGVLSVKNVYEFAVLDPDLTWAQQQHILGVQAELWTEHIQTEQRVEWMALPRAAALAEVAWSPQLRRWPDFARRLPQMFARYRMLGINYADSVFAVAPQFSSTAAGVRVTLAHSPELNDAALKVDIRYTLDGHDPDSAAKLYTDALDLPVGTDIRAASFLDSEQVSRVWNSHLDAHQGPRRTSHELAPCGNAVGLLLEPLGSPGTDAPYAVDVVSPCWMYRGADLTRGPQFSAAVAPLPFNYELGPAGDHIRVGDARTHIGELEVHIDTCDGPAAAVLELAPAALQLGVTQLPPQQLPAMSGRHDLCLRFARPRLDPLWALVWAQIGS
jgi:hexosaminidase